jgi:hypothetical protein
VFILVLVLFHLLSVILICWHHILECLFLKCYISVSECELVLEVTCGYLSECRFTNGTVSNTSSTLNFLSEDFVKVDIILLLFQYCLYRLFLVLTNLCHKMF